MVKQFRGLQINAINNFSQKQMQYCTTFGCKIIKIKLTGRNNISAYMKRRTEGRKVKIKY